MGRVNGLDVGDLPKRSVLEFTVLACLHTSEVTMRRGTTSAVDNVEEQIATKSATSSSKTTSSAISENHSYQHQESYIEQVSSSVSKSKQYIQQTASEEFLVRERLVNGKHDSVSTLNSVQQSSTSSTTNSCATNGNGTTEHDNHLNGTTQSSSRFHVFKLDRLNTPQTGGTVTGKGCMSQVNATSINGRAHIVEVSFQELDGSMSPQTRSGDTLKYGIENPSTNDVELLARIASVASDQATQMVPIK
uniref:Uncharacterized protein n=1 Tax=Anopheles christyi TaxID=43041 RepID=A0A182K9A0_9DIPT